MKIWTFFLALWVGLQASAQTQAVVQQNGQSQTYQIEKLGSGGNGTVFQVKTADGNDFAIKRFNLEFRNIYISGNKIAAQAVQKKGEDSYLLDTQLIEVSFDGGPVETAARMPLLMQGDPRVSHPSQFFRDFFFNYNWFRNFDAKEDPRPAFKAKIRDIQNIWIAGIRGSIEYDDVNAGHSDIKRPNFLWDDSRKHYVLGDHDQASLILFEGRPGTTAFLPPDIWIVREPGLSRDLFSLALTIAGELEQYPRTVWHYHYSTSYLEKGDRAVQRIKRDLEDFRNKILLEWPADTLPEEKRLFESLVKFSLALSTFHKADRDVAVLALLKDPELDPDMKRELLPLKERIIVPRRPWSIANFFGPLTTPLRSAYRYCAGAFM